MNSLKLSQSIELIVKLLSTRSFDELVKLDLEKQMTAADFAEALDSEYGGIVTMPKEGVREFDFCPVDGEDHLLLDYKLIINEKVSDLTLQCQFSYDEGRDIYPFSIYSIHVL